MTVKELINKLQEFDENYEVEIQYYNKEWCQYVSRPSIDRRITVYEDEEWYEWPRVLIDLWDF